MTILYVDVHTYFFFTHVKDGLYWVIRITIRYYSHILRADVWSAWSVLTHALRQWNRCKNHYFLRARLRSGQCVFTVYIEICNARIAEWKIIKSYLSSTYLHTFYFNKEICYKVNYTRTYIRVIKQKYKIYLYNYICF